VKTVALKEIAEIERKSVSPSDIEEGETYVGLEHITSDGGFINVDTVAKGELQSNKFLFSSSHILYGKLRPYLAKIASPSFGGVCSTDILPIRPGPEVYRSYLMRFLRSPEMVAEASRMSQGANLPRLSPSALAAFQVPLPPLEEQRRIASILDAADALRTKRRKALAKLDTLTQAIFIDMFGDPVANSKGWPRISLVDVCEKIGSGATPRGGQATYCDSGTKLIRSMNVHDRRFARTGLAHIDDEQAAKLDGVTVQEGDVLLNITGASVARVCLAPAFALPARVNQHVAIIRPNRQKLSNVYLAEALASHSMKSELLRGAGSGATREAITKRDIEDLELICPPRELQSEFENACKSAHELSESNEGATGVLDRLFAALQQRAFRGEL
jgi:type I restriction enzyme S subunit